MGPGLLGSLLVGTSFAKSLSLVSNILNRSQPSEDTLWHILLMKEKNATFLFYVLRSFEVIQIVVVKGYFDMEVIGETLDDAAGEAFDKSAKILGLGDPRTTIDKYAKKALKPLNLQNPVWEI